MMVQMICIGYGWTNDIEYMSMGGHCRMRKPNEILAQCFVNEFGTLNMSLLVFMLKISVSALNDNFCSYDKLCVLVCVSV